MRIVVEPRAVIPGVPTPLRLVGRPADRAAQRHPPGAGAAVGMPGARPEPERGPVRVLVAEADTLMRDGLRRILEAEGFEVVGAARDADELGRLADELRPGLVITEVALPGEAGDGLDAALRLRAAPSPVAVVVLSAIADVPRGVELLASGPGVGYLLRHSVTDVRRFALDLRRVAAGGIVVDPALLEAFITTRQTGDTLRALSPREREVLALVAEGHSNARVAERLWVTRDTVEKHIQSILFKLGVPEDDRLHRRVVAVLLYLRATGAVAPAGPDAAAGDVVA